jgi:hypothetical protein
MMTGTAAIVRAMLTKKCVESCGDTPGSISFTYPAEYVEGMEYSCALTVCPEAGTHVVLYKMDKLIGEFSLGNGRNRSEKIANLIRALEEFQKFCSRCDDDLLFIKTLMARAMMMTKTPVPSRVFLA